LLQVRESAVKISGAAFMSEAADAAGVPADIVTEEGVNSKVQVPTEEELKEEIKNIVSGVLSPW
jgi:methyl coenzyme M reductase subunit C